jgi:hypothetical protein
MKYTTHTEPAMNTTLTTLEADLLNACLNYTDNIESQLNDNFSNCDLYDAREICGGRHQAAGVIGSLCKKGLIEDPASDEDRIIWLTEDGIHAIYNHNATQEAGA